MKAYKIFALMLAFIGAFTLVSCSDEENGNTNVSSTEGYFFTQNFAFNVSTNPVIQIPIVRLGTEGDLTVNVSSTGSSEFTVPASVVIKDGERIGNLEVTYNKSSLNFNQLYTLELTVQNFTSIYGYEKATATIEYPTSYFEYGKGTIVEDWWGEQEDKTMYAREYAANVYQCYLPDCWGHDSGPGYDVKDYIFYWNTETNKVYIPLQLMGTDNWSIADQGAIACKFGGPDYKEGSAQWMAFIDQFYAQAGQQQPYYNPEKKAFYLSDTAAVSPEDGSVVYGNPGRFDIFTLE